MALESSYDLFLPLVVISFLLCLSRRDEDLVACGACTSCWFITTDMLLNMLFHVTHAPPARDDVITNVNDELKKLLQPRSTHQLCDDVFLPKCVAPNPTRKP